ncbi:GNAT family N-acetyltransferase [Natronomonas marina]|jgi:GNAT superfamily N-acetyltransferase|uniref:GNAT family N-acetyltransferase n=1 Tax=Natronomonas marina TaxID=2961939 RepID=UPI0020C974D8|nr:GNAT family N-acetyltransferase [Natronomonas marina]
MTREYPTEIAGPYEAPPRSFTDHEGRDIDVRQLEDDFEALVEMYRSFDPEDRAQGIPPTDEQAIREWLETLVETDCINVVACHDGSVVGHAMLVPDRHGASELAIFVLRAYQEAGIGTALVEALLGAGRRDGVERIWLTVERWNSPAIALYQKVGFETSDPDGFELEMAAKLSNPDD